MTVAARGNWSRLAFAGWILLAINAAGTGLYSLRYVLPRIPLPILMPNFFDRRGWLIAHATCSSIALLLGPWQFLPGLRARFLNLHRWMGRIYCVAVLAGWIASLPIAAHAETGSVASAGFLLLGIVWSGSTAMAWVSIRGGRVQAHREWMVRSYALTAAAITLRIYLPLSLVAGVPFTMCYPTIAWMCWVPNLVFAEWLIRRSRVKKRALAGF